ncbi:DUF2075 domain-containing protein [Enterococcus xiangfangensis]|uniref:DUF2075 domain-containing protein n=1 Tax=Enterococcus xiangfangensis TaxID=1296537 RepID=UPI0010F532F5|nr:DUF2075 domain-containing protein [Enterococcus xiangfangensis]MBM7711084.1 DUF2075 family protein/predicted GIY-YIG superfamily endonuclease/archaellum biogenesis ATPase FlaH [Enterococcus xiangfangensis]
MKLSKPIIYEIDYSKESLNSLEEKIQNKGKKEQKVMLSYPTVYIVNDKKGSSKYSVYIGETADIKRRTIEHLKELREDWQELSDSDQAKMFVVGHEHFNKSLTLDIENRLMQYLSSVEAVENLNNRRTNPQNDCYTSEELGSIFSEIWKKLQQKNKELFPLERIIRDSAIFKASPFHKLTREQMNAREDIILKVTEAINRNKEGQLIIVEGEAGSGKTVLLSSLFYELSQLSLEESENVVLKNTNQYLLVNHNQQLKVYEQIASKLGILSKRNQDVVSKPTRFINNHSEDEKVDIVVVDEAHLLWTQGKQSYRGKNQLKDLLKRAKVVVAVLDRNQILSREQYWDEQDMLETIHEANLNNNYIHLENQLRINADKETVKWIRNLIDNGTIERIPVDSKNYAIKIFDDPEEMYKRIQKKAQNEESGISRILATFDWDYVDKRKPNDEEYWNVKIGEWRLPWNLQLPQTRKEKRRTRNQAWAEQAQTIGEVGSTFTIQGFDLNYAGVIIGPSVKYRDGKIIFDKTASKNKKAIQMRAGKNGEKIDVSDFLLKNELNVLMTRGVNGLYIYAVDKELREALKKARN